MNFKPGSLPSFSVCHSRRSGFSEPSPAIWFWTTALLKWSITAAMANTPPRRSYRLCSVTARPPCRLASDGAERAPALGRDGPLEVRATRSSGFAFPDGLEWTSGLADSGSGMTLPEGDLKCGNVGDPLVDERPPVSRLIRKLLPFGRVGLQRRGLACDVPPRRYQVDEGHPSVVRKGPFARHRGDLRSGQRGRADRMTTVVVPPR